MLKNPVFSLAWVTRTRNKITMGKKRKLAKDNDLEYDPVPKHLVTSHIKKQEKRLIVILENAQLETVKVRLK